MTEQNQEAGKVSIEEYNRLKNEYSEQVEIRRKLIEGLQYALLEEECKVKNECSRHEKELKDVKTDIEQMLIVLRALTPEDANGMILIERWTDKYGLRRVFGGDKK